jgi:hypothetical protein
MNSKLLSATVGAVTAMGVVSGAQAVSLYSQSPNIGFSAYFSSSTSSIEQQLADPFSIAAGGTIGQVSWYGYSSGGTFGNFDIYFYANNGGIPGTNLEAIDGVAPQVTVVTIGLTHFYQFTYDLSTSFVAAAGTTYFFSVLEHSPIPGSFNFAWEPSGGHVGGVYTTDGGLSWSSSGLGSDQAFTLFTADVSGTPLPATLPLFTTGLGALGLLGWRRKKKAAAF